MHLFSVAVSLGGIAGLFIGFSLLSGAEIIYYLTLKLFRDLCCKRKQKGQHIHRVSPMNTVQDNTHFFKTVQVIRPYKKTISEYNG